MPKSKTSRRRINIYTWSKITSSLRRSTTILTMSTVRMDISETSGNVDRTLPSLLQDYVTESAWQEFCEKVEQAVKPAIRLRFLTPVLFLGLFLVTVIIFVAPFIMMDSSSGGPPIGPFVIAPILWVVTIGGYLACTCRFHGKIMQDLRSICEQESQKYPNLSFHLKEEQYYVHHMHSGSHHGGGYGTKYYIEILIASFHSPPANSPTFVPDVEAIPVVTAETNLPTPASRLEQLEKIKHHLTPEEYAQKRRDIVRSL